MAETITLATKDVRMDALVSRPAAPGSRAGVVVTFHREGLDEFTRWKVDQLAAAGFTAIAPGHYHVLPPGVGFLEREPYLTDEQMASDIEAAARWLLSQAGVDPGRLAVLGPCMGGRTTLVAAECFPQLWRCACVWYGGSAFKPMKGGLAAPADRERLARIACPIEGYFGGLDKNPSPQDVDRLDGLLTELGKPHVFYRYPNAGHGFLNPWHKHYDAEAAADSWSKALNFLHRHLAVAQAVN